MVPGSGFIAAASGGRARMAHIYASPCSKVTPRCADAQSYRRCSYSAREARRRASGDDEVWRLSPIVGQGDHASIRRPWSPPIDRVWIECAGEKKTSCRSKN
jgi:hypothetical protein